MLACAINLMGGIIHAPDGYGAPFRRYFPTEKIDLGEAELRCSNIFALQPALPELFHAENWSIMMDFTIGQRGERENWFSGVCSFPDTGKYTRFYVSPGGYRYSTTGGNSTVGVYSAVSIPSQQSPGQDSIFASAALGRFRVQSERGHLVATCDTGQEHSVLCDKYLGSSRTDNVPTAYIHSFAWANLGKGELRIASWFNHVTGTYASMFPLRSAATLNETASDAAVFEYAEKNVKEYA